MATFKNDDVARIRAALAPFENPTREFAVEIRNYGHRIEMSVCQFADGEQYRNGCLFDMDDPGNPETYAELGHDRTIEAFIGLCMILLVGYTNRVKARHALVTEE